MDYSGPLGYERTQVALQCPRLSDDNGPIPLAELKTYITPTAAELKKATEGKALGDPADLEQCLPEKGHPAMLTIRRAGNGAGGGCKSTGEKGGHDCDNKPTHTGSESARIDFAGETKPPTQARVVVNKPAAFVAKPTLGKFEEIDDAWAGLSVEAMMNEKPEYGKIAVEELYKLHPEPIKVLNPLALNKNYEVTPYQVPDVRNKESTKEAPVLQPPAKKNKVEELPKLKRCAHMEINDASAPADNGTAKDKDFCKYAQSLEGYTAEVEEYPWGRDDEQQAVVQDDVGTLGWENATNLPVETENLASDDGSTEAMKNENDGDSSIVILEHNSSNDFDGVRQPAPMPGLQIAHEIERTPIRPRPQITSRIPVRRQGRAIRFPRPGLPVIHESKGKAPKDIEGNISASNIVSGRRVRKQTPAGTPTHTTWQQQKRQTRTSPCQSRRWLILGIRYMDVCLFTRVLRKPEKILRQMPEVAKARKTEIQGLYDAGSLEWSTWAEADREKIKPIRTGFVDAIKVDEASGVSKYKSRLVIFGNQMIPFLRDIVTCRTAHLPFNSLFIACRYGCLH
eukprot:g75247.t1